MHSANPRRLKFSTEYTPRKVSVGSFAKSLHPAIAVWHKAARARMAQPILTTPSAAHEHHEIDEDYQRDSANSQKRT